MTDSVDCFSFETDVERRRENNDNEDDDDDDHMRNAEIDRDDDSMNDRSETDRRDFFSKKDFSKEIYLSADWTFWRSIENDFWLFWEWKNENRCLIDWTNFVCDDRSRDDDSRRDSDRDFVCHE